MHVQRHTIIVSDKSFGYLVQKICCKRQTAIAYSTRTFKNLTYGKSERRYLYYIQDYISKCRHSLHWYTCRGPCSPTPGKIDKKEWPIFIKSSGWRIIIANFKIKYLRILQQVYVFWISNISNSLVFVGYEFVSYQFVAYEFSAHHIDLYTL